MFLDKFQQKSNLNASALTVKETWQHLGLPLIWKNAWGWAETALVLLAEDRQGLLRKKLGRMQGVELFCVLLLD